MRTQIKDLAHRLKLPNRTVTQALRLLEHLSKKHRMYVQGLKPLSVSASCLYLMGLLEGQGPTQRDLCRAAEWKISEHTIRRHYQGIAEKLQLAGLPAISIRRRFPGRQKYVCPLCGEFHKNLELWRLHIKHDHHLVGWGIHIVRTRDFNRDGNLANRQLLERIREAERRRAQTQKMLDWIEERIGK
jgi:hypothetical protein